jgi:sigma-B regulation protein RsbU (phosphoserine phosphatase)
VQRALEGERQTAELREQFIAVLGHDLRNPLAAIVATAGLLQRREKLSDEGARFLRLMDGSAQRMTALIDNVLDLARGRHGGGFTLDRRIESIECTLQQVVDELKATHPDRQIWTDWAVTGEIALDHRRIAQMVSNLVANALAHGAPDQPISVLGSSTAQRFEVSVTNAGTPIPPAAMERLFQPFFREDVRSNQQGLGLGLYIVAEIAKAHGGSVDVASTADATTFTVHIPAGDRI